MPTLPYGTGQLIDPTMARSLHADACRNHAITAWVVFWDLPAYPERFAARLVTSGQAAWPYLLVADTLDGIRAMLPPGLVRSERMPVDPPEVVRSGSRSSRRINSPDPRPAQSDHGAFSAPRGQTAVRRA
jgi:hypothetical protein